MSVDRRELAEPVRAALIEAAPRGAAGRLGQDRRQHPAARGIPVRKARKRHLIDPAAARLP